MHHDDSNDSQEIAKDEIWRQLEQKRFENLKHAGIKL